MKKLGGHLDDLDKDPSECIFEKKICTSSNDIKIIKHFLIDEKQIEQLDLSDKEIIEKAKKYLNVDSEAGIWENHKFKHFAGINKSTHIVKNIFKPKGPANSTALLDNFNIDETLSQWSKHSKELFGKKYYHIPFQMIDFDKTGTELSRFSIMELLESEYDCFGVVLNTDISSGRGKHWFCLYGDLNHNGTKEDPYTLEYFNSSGNPPMIQVDIFLKRTVYDLLKETGQYCEIIRSAHKRLQYSQTECGVWSLMYIKSRLDGHPYDYFYKRKTSDAEITEMRKRIFRQ